jgi:hypothetical protein
MISQKIAVLMAVMTVIVVAATGLTGHSGVIFALAAAIVVFLWGPRTLTRYRFA